MVETLPLDLEENQAIVMDEIFYSNRSLKKRSEIFLEETINQYMPDQLAYLINIILLDIISEGDENHVKTLQKYLKLLNVSSFSFPVTIAFIIVEYHFSKHYSTIDFKVLNKALKEQAEAIGIDYDKVIKDQLQGIKE